MGIFSILAFWRKKEKDDNVGNENEQDFEYGEQQTEIPPWNNEYDNTGMKRKNFQQENIQREWQQPMQQSQQGYGNGHEIILAKLDVINIKLDSLNQRLANLERYAAEDEKKSRW
ncbi:hypothetical protein HYT56_04330 [Candidatus Woesearchaeota archaeon]|nr:hypothetical protein [Candidatus Woesearchaeota archaeon]